MTGGFTQGIGQWRGTAEVFAGDGQFLGNGTDQRHVQPMNDGRVRIDVAFIGPFKHAGHYFIQNNSDHRLYQGPANVGYAETLADNLVDAHAYWPALGLSQRFFLMVLPDEQTQLSLALMSRGEQLIYSVVGQNNRVSETNSALLPALISGTSYDLADDPSAGRETLLVHRSGLWSGTLALLDHQRESIGNAFYEEALSCEDKLLTTKIKGGGFAPEENAFTLITNGWQTWSKPGNVAGSYSLSGGRALSGHFHYLEHGLRVWRREVVTHDGTQKAVLHIWYRGGARVGIQFGVLHFQPIS